MGFENNLTIALLSYFLKMSGGGRIFTSERFAPLQAASVSSQSDALSIVLCSRIASI